MFALSNVSGCFNDDVCMCVNLSQSDDDPPTSLSFDSIVMDVCCHPSRDVVAVGDIDGRVSM